MYTVYWCLPYLLVWKALVGVYWRNFRCYNNLSTGQSDKMKVASALCLGYTNVIPWPTFKHTHKWYIFWHLYIQLKIWQIHFQSDLSATLQYFKWINTNSFKQTNNTTWNIENLDYHRLWVQLFAWQLCLNIILHHRLKSHQIKPMDLGDLIDVCLLCLLNGRTGQNSPTCHGDFFREIQTNFSWVEGRSLVAESARISHMSRCRPFRKHSLSTEKKMGLGESGL